MSHEGEAPPPIIGVDIKHSELEKSLSVQESISEISDSDVAKFPALFGVRQIIKSDPQEARNQLCEVESQNHL